MHKHDEAGFTLAELLVSTVVTLMVLAAALGAFADAMRITDSARETTDTNQNIEVALSLMVRDFIQAGSQGYPIGGVPIPSGAGAVALDRPAPAGSSLTFPATYEVMPAIAPGGGQGPLVLGVTTDMVTIMYVDPASPSITINGDQADPGSISADGSTMTVPSGTDISGADALQEGDLLFFDGGKKAIQMVTGISGQTVSFGAGDDLNINQRGAASGTILQLSDDGVYPVVEVKRVLMISYYIDLVTDPELPRLVRQVNNGPRLAVALGIENLQITFDLVDGTDNPTNVETPADPYSPHQIRKANLFLAGRSLDVNPRTRQFYRNTAATQVSLRSLTFVDRYTPADEDED